MKLAQLHETKYDTEMNKFPNVVAAMRIGVSLKKDFTLDNLAWICALDDTEYIDEAGHDAVANLRYDPGRGFKGNPEDMNEYLEMHFDPEEVDEKESYEWLKDWIERA